MRARASRLWRSEVLQLKGAWPLSCGQHTPGATAEYPPIRASAGVTCPGHGEIGSSGDQGFSTVVFPTPLLLRLNFSLGRDLSVCRIWGGYFGRRRSGWRGPY